MLVQNKKKKKKKKRRRRSYGMTDTSSHNALISGSL
jgi:hypothetical protein